MSALGHQGLTGSQSDRIEVLNLDERGDPFSVAVDDALIGVIREKIEGVAADTRSMQVPCGRDHSKDTALNDAARLAGASPAS